MIYHNITYNIIRPSSPNRPRLHTRSRARAHTRAAATTYAAATTAVPNARARTHTHTALAWVDTMGSITSPPRCGPPRRRQTPATQERNLSHRQKLTAPPSDPRDPLVPAPRLCQGAKNRTSLFSRRLPENSEVLFLAL